LVCGIEIATRTPEILAGFPHTSQGKAKGGFAMRPCYFCKSNPIKYGVLCESCSVLVQTDELKKNAWAIIREKKSESSKKFRDQLVSKKPLSQFSAEQKVRKIAKYFGLKIKSEKILGPYILDIFIPRIKVAIEIDGGCHNDRSGYDDSRDEYFKRLKIATYRFENEVIKTKFFKEAIWNIINTKYMAHYKKVLAKAKELGINLQEV